MTGPDDAPQRPDHRIDNRGDSLMTTTTLPVDGGSTTVECTTCSWLLPGEQHEGHGIPQRPAGADYTDAAHITDTGHAVRVTSTTTHATGLVERSAQLISPRTTSKETNR